jgi:hypothetical protein
VPHAKQFREMTRRIAPFDMEIYFNRADQDPTVYVRQRNPGGLGEPGAKQVANGSGRTETVLVRRRVLLREKAPRIPRVSCAEPMRCLLVLSWTS